MKYSVTTSLTSWNVTGNDPEATLRLEVIGAYPIQFTVGSITRDVKPFEYWDVAMRPYTVRAKGIGGSSSFRTFKQVGDAIDESDINGTVGDVAVNLDSLTKLSYDAETEETSVNGVLKAEELYVSGKYVNTAQDYYVNIADYSRSLNTAQVSLDTNNFHIDADLGATAFYSITDGPSPAKLGLRMDYLPGYALSIEQILDGNDFVGVTVSMSRFTLGAGGYTPSSIVKTFDATAGFHKWSVQLNGSGTYLDFDFFIDGVQATALTSSSDNLPKNSNFIGFLVIADYKNHEANWNYSCFKVRDVSCDGRTAAEYFVGKPAYGNSKFNLSGNIASAFNWGSLMLNAYGLGGFSTTTSSDSYGLLVLPNGKLMLEISWAETTASIPIFSYAYGSPALTLLDIYIETDYLDSAISMRVGMNDGTYTDVPVPAVSGFNQLTHLGEFAFRSQFENLAPVTLTPSVAINANFNVYIFYKN